jgi:hypothetical protein
MILMGYLGLVILLGQLGQEDSPAALSGVEPHMFYLSRTSITSKSLHRYEEEPAARYEWLV